MLYFKMLLIRLVARELCKGASGLYKGQLVISCDCELNGILL